MPTREEYEKELKAKHEHLGAIELHSGVVAYFRRPTQEEHDTFQSLAVDGGEGRNIAYNRYVRGCFVGAFPECTLEHIVAIEGPGIIGTCGKLVNRLAGVEERPTRML